MEPHVKLMEIHIFVFVLNFTLELIVKHVLNFYLILNKNFNKILY